MSPRASSNLPTRVSLLEHSVQEVRTGLDSHRAESRQGFADLQVAIAKRATPTNWYAVIGAIVGAITIVGAIFGLAEWRVGTALEPLRDARSQIERLRDSHTDIRVQLGVEKALRERAAGR